MTNVDEATQGVTESVDGQVSGADVCEDVDVQEEDKYEAILNEQPINPNDVIDSSSQKEDRGTVTSNAGSFSVETWPQRRKKTRRDLSENPDTSSSCEKKAADADTVEGLIDRATELAYKLWPEAVTQGPELKMVTEKVMGISGEAFYGWVASINTAEEQLSSVKGKKAPALEGRTKARRKAWRNLIVKLEEEIHAKNQGSEDRLIRIPGGGKDGTSKQQAKGERTKRDSARTEESKGSTPRPPKRAETFSSWRRNKK